MAPSLTELVDVPNPLGRYGFGLLLKHAGVTMRDWSAAYRVPYWNHRSLVDWSGAMHGFAVPSNRVLIAPSQYLFHDEIKLCGHTGLTHTAWDSPPVAHSFSPQCPVGPDAH